MDIFQRRWEMARREYVELLNEWVAIDRAYLRAVGDYRSNQVTLIEEMVENYMTIEMIAHALTLSVDDVNELIAAFKAQRTGVREWQVKADDFQKRTGKEVQSFHTENFYRVEREYTYNGPGDYILSAKPFDESMYSLYPDFPQQSEYGFKRLV